MSDDIKREWWGVFNYGNRLLYVARTRRDAWETLCRETFGGLGDEFEANRKHYQVRRVSVTFKDAR